MMSEKKCKQPSTIYLTVFIFGVHYGAFTEKSNTDYTFSQYNFSLDFVCLDNSILVFSCCFHISCIFFTQIFLQFQRQQIVKCIVKKSQHHNFPFQKSPTYILSRLGCDFSLCFKFRGARFYMYGFHNFVYAICKFHIFLVFKFLFFIFFHINTE